MASSIPKELNRVHGLLDVLAEKLGSLEHLYFAYPHIRTEYVEGYYDPSSVVAGAISVSREPSKAILGDEAIRKRIDEKHPIPSSYIKLNGVVDVEFSPSRKSLKKLRTKRCLVIERWGEEFVCRVPDGIRDEIDRKAVSLVAIPPAGAAWSIPIVRALQDVAKKIGVQKVDYGPHT